MMRENKNCTLTTPYIMVLGYSDSGRTEYTLHVYIFIVIINYLCLCILRVSLRMKWSVLQFLQPCIHKHEKIIKCILINSVTVICNFLKLYCIYCISRRINITAGLGTMCELLCSIKYSLILMKSSQWIHDIKELI